MFRASKLVIFFIVLCSTFTSCFYSSLWDNKSIVRTENIPFPKKENFIWGINGHPIWSKDYESVPLKQEIDLLKEYQFAFYRIDINTDLEGNVRESKLKRFEDLLELAKQYNITILPVLRIYEHLENKNFNLSEAEAFNMGFNQAKGFSIKYGNFFNYYGLGNEMDLKTILSKELDGREMGDFDQEKVLKISSYLKGMIKALQQYDDNSKTIVNSSNPRHFGFYKLLDDHGVKYDILSFHWYSKDGVGLFDLGTTHSNDIKTLKLYFNKPIWITEINKYDGSRYNSESQQAYMMEVYIEDLKKQNLIDAFFVYELYDQPFLATQKWTNYNPSFYGIVGWKTNPPNYSDYYYKPVSNVLKFRIEESKHGYEDYIHAVLTDLYEEVPSENDFRYWTNRLEILKNKETVIKEIMENQLLSMNKTLMKSDNSENYVPQIISVYELFLKRTPVEKEIKYWNRKLKKQLKVQDLPINILLSEEYWENAIWKGYEKRTGKPRPL